ncbi:MAG: aminotransferase class I/II-fold pyridoxal phosphate-dependent enzyme [Bacteriovoracales bacterium]|nr:aminotransferase class I/II-fold pyridoxal phosphate-dependent enzyme [Bacteriovoracales bacterium]
MLSERVQNARESITLKLNATAEELRREGKTIYNLTAGQLPFPPESQLIDEISKQLPKLASFQYSPVPGFPELRKKATAYVEKTRGIRWEEGRFDCVISTGAKQSIFNLVASIVDPGDEVIVLAPYWVSYPEIIRYWGGQCVVVGPSQDVGKDIKVQSIKEAITPKTKAILLNTPGNPSGVYYSQQWVHEFAELIVSYPQIQILSDEIYSQLYYDGPGPRFPYQFRPELLDRTFIIDGISKSMACTGLRIGFSFGPKKTMKAMSTIQGQSTSGANSLIQKALMNYNFSDIENYLDPIKDHLRNNSALVREKLDQYSLSKAWYQTNGAFYFLMSFEGLPILERFKKSGSKGKDGDYAADICEGLIEETGVVMVPSSDFGQTNGGRISLVLEKKALAEALDLAFGYLSST